MIQQFDSSRYPKDMKTRFEYLICTHVYCSIIHSSQDVETTKVPVKDEWIIKRWYIYRTEYYSATRKEDILLFGKNMDGPWEHGVKWGKTDRQTSTRLYRLHVESKKSLICKNRDKWWFQGNPEGPPEAPCSLGVWSSLRALLTHSVFTECKPHTHHAWRNISWLKNFFSTSYSIWVMKCTCRPRIIKSYKKVCS